MSEYIQLTLLPDYEIMIDYPNTIRKISDKKIVDEYINKKNGYVYVFLDNPYLKHRIIAQQFIQNDDPNNKIDINHINHVRSDNHINNLEWCTRSENLMDRTGHLGVKYKFVDELPEDAFNILQYETKTEIHEFDEERYWYSSSTDLFYFNNKRNYRILHLSYKPGCYKRVCMTDINKNSVNISYDTFKNQYINRF